MVMIVQIPPTLLSCGIERMIYQNDRLEKHIDFCNSRKIWISIVSEIRVKLS